MGKRTVLVTGGASGIGRAISARYAKEGWRVVIVDHSEQKTLETVRDLNSFPGGIHYRVMDITCHDSIRNLFEEWEQAYGRLDVLVNNAAYNTNKPLLLTEREEWDRTMDVNVGGVYQFCRSAHPLLKASQGLILNIGSILGLNVYGGNTSYAVSKAALHHMTKALAAEWRVHGIRVNVVCPSTVDTPLLRELRERRGLSPEEVEQTICEGIAAGQIQTAEQIANLVYLLSTPDASVLNGVVLVADGGSQLARGGKKDR